MTTENADTSLTKATMELREEIRAQYPARIRDTWDRDSEALGRHDFSSAPAVGSQAPNFRLPDARGGEVELAELRARGPVVVVFYRGAWCPYCNLQLAAFQRALDDITAAGASLVAISPQTPDSSLTLAERAGLEFHVLSDVGNRTAREYGLVFTQAETSTAVSREVGLELRDYNADDSHELPAASTFVISPDGIVRFASVAGDYRWRVGPEEVLAALAASARIGM
jgi:peroxiredoxin